MRPVPVSVLWFGRILPRFLAQMALLFAAIGAAAGEDGTMKIMTSDDLVNFAQPAPTARLAYGPGPLQFGDLRLPSGAGPHPVVVFIHGGCWLSDYDIAHSSEVTAAFAAAGIASWSLEYRRVGDEGGGWPGTFQDVAAGADFLREIAGQYALNLEQVIVAGHSAGGQLAIWLAARDQLPPDSPLASEQPLVPKAVLGLAPAPDLEALYADDVCGRVIEGLLGGSPEQFPQRYRQVSPMQFAPLTTPQLHIIGRHDTFWGPVGRSYLGAAMARGDAVTVLEAPEAGHFELIAPGSSSWGLVLEAARSLLANID